MPIIANNSAELSVSSSFSTTLTSLKEAEDRHSVNNATTETESHVNNVKALHQFQRQFAELRQTYPEYSGISAVQGSINTFKNSVAAALSVKQDSAAELTELNDLFTPSL